MAQNEFEIEISRGGKVTIRTIGIKGPRCVDEAELIAKIVGQVDSRETTHEYYETEAAVQNQYNIRRRS